MHDVSLQLKWWHQFQFAGYYAAVKEGYYAKAGLRVTIKPGGEEIDAVQQVLTGAADFGITGSELLSWYASGKPLVALGALFQHSPYVIMSLSESGIRAPSDLIGKKVMVAETQGWVEMKAMFLKEGIDPEKIFPVSHSWNNNDLVDGRVVAMTGYRSAEPYQLLRAGAKVSFIEPVTYGIDFYGDILFTSRNLVKKQPAVVESFRKASFKGWEYALSHKDEICDYILTLPGVKARGVTKDELLFEAEEMEKLILPQLIEIGHMNEGRWQHILDVYKQLGLIRRDVTLPGFIYERKPSLGESLKNIGIVVVASVAGLFLIILIYGFVVRAAVKRKTRDQRLALQALTVSEERYRTLIEQASDGIVSVNPQLKFTQANSAALQLLGYSENELMQLYLPDVLVTNDSEPAWLVDQLENKGSLLTERQARRKDGTTFIVEIKSTRLSNGNYLGFIRDITERKTLELEKERRAMERERLISDLSDSISELKQFSYITSHNLRAPVTNLLALTKLIDLENIPDAETRKLVESFAISTRELNDTLNDLIRILIIKEERNIPHEIVSIEEVFQRAMTALRTMIDNSGAVVTTDFSGCPEVSYNAAYLESIFTNLLSNSLKYAQPGRRPEITVSSKMENGEPWLYFADNGRGFDIGKVGDRVFGLHQRFHHHPESRGVGLYLIQSQILSLGGTVKVESEVGKGTRFIICLRKQTSPGRLMAGK